MPITYSAIALIYNPNSTGPSTRKAKRWKVLLSRSFPHTQIELLATEYAGHAEKLANEFAKKHTDPLIISVSGDGGYNEVINGALKAQEKGHSPICCVLPAGNANDHRRSVRTKMLLPAIRKQRITKIDLLKITIEAPKSTTVRYAHSYIGLGFSPEVARELNKEKLTRSKELRIVVRTFFRFNPFKIVINDQVKTLDSLIFSNIRFMAKILKLSKGARHDDGKFEVTLSPHLNKFTLAKLVLRASTYGLNTAKTAKSFDFTTIGRLSAQLDGEVITLPAQSKVCVSIVPNTLRSII